MKLTPSISEDEMVSLFMRSQASSPRVNKTIIAALNRDGKETALVEAPDTSNDEDNRYRQELLTMTRGYESRTKLFTGFPNDVTWHWGEITKEELRKLKYIDYPYWAEISGGTRAADDAAKNEEVSENLHISQLVSALQRGERFLPLIIVGTSENSSLVVLDGHHRLTAYASKWSLVPETIRVMVGFSPDMDKWKFY